MAPMDKEISDIYTIVKKNYNHFGAHEIRRFLHGRGGTYPGLQFLSIDCFPPALLITLYEERDDKWKQSLADTLMGIEAVQVIVFQTRVKAPWKNEILRGTLPEEHVCEEEGLKYSITLDRGENPGIFPDMREGRKCIREISRGKRVLNLFSYTCAFSIAAVEGGAESVLNLDMNSNSLNRGRLNHQLNEHNKAKVQYLSHNILKSFGKIVKKGPYDLVIIDPPPSQGNSFNLERDYGKILRRTKDFLVENGEILLCLNSHQYNYQWFEDFLQNHLGDYKILRKIGSGEDFPEENEESGLKIIHLTILS
jgi:23S rRNA (cytosine1962-C5)-methyltransferase